MTKLEQPITVPIKKIVEDNSLTKTFYFDLDLKAKPGQFIMFWLPGVDLKPFGVSYQKNGVTGVTICKVGPVTEKMFALKIGEIVGLQGPYGTFFDTSQAKNRVLFFLLILSFFFKFKLIKRKRKGGEINHPLLITSAIFWKCLLKIVNLTASGSIPGRLKAILAKNGQ